MYRRMTPRTHLRCAQQLPTSCQPAVYLSAGLKGFVLGEVLEHEFFSGR
ncbi:hypothetical protein [Anaerosinus sp.]